MEPGDKADLVSLRIPITELYGLSDAADLDTDVVDDSSNQSFIRLSKDIVLLGEHKFPCKVDSESCSAKFIKSKGILVVTAKPLPLLDSLSIQANTPQGGLASLNRGTDQPLTRSLPSPAPPTASTSSAEPDERTVKLAEGIDCEMLGRSLGGWDVGGSSSLALPGKVGRGDGVDLKKKAVNQMCLVAKMLKEDGFAVLNSFVPPALVERARKEIHTMEAHYTPGEIWLGAKADQGAQIAVNDVRGDKVLWMDEQALTATAFIKEGKKTSCSFATLHHIVHTIDRLIKEELPKLVKELEGVDAGGRSDAMLAIYPPKARFQKHIDNTAEDGRRLTLLCYLNGEWGSEKGGALRLFSPQCKDPVVDVLPLCGRLAFFWSKTVAHEVCRTFRHRHSFTLWYYDALEKAEALAKARVDAGSEGAKPAAQASAKNLIKDIMSSSNGIESTREGCTILAQRVKAMTTSALSIVAGIVGASSVSEFVSCASSLSPDTLTYLRNQISNMGLGHNHAPRV